MRLALVFNPFKYKLHEENLRIVVRYFGLFPPLSLAWVAAIAERAGHQVTIIDARTLRLTPDQVLRQLRRFRPDMIGFMMTTYMFRETLEWARYLKQQLGVPVILGGYNLRVYPRESLQNDVADYGVVNSAFYTLPRLLEELERGSPSLDDVPGLVYKRGDQVIVTPEHETPERFEDYPNPARHLLPNELYAEFPTERRNFTVMVTSKGCPRGCSFCEAGRTRYNARSTNTVVDEMEQCIEHFGIHEIDIFDYEFLINRKRALAICKEMQRRRLDVIWACRARIDSVDDELLRQMKAAGCNRIYYGIESGVQRILDEVNKGLTLEQIRETIRLTKKHDIRALGFFLIGSPGESLSDIRQTISFAKELDLNYIQFSKLTAKPLTPLWKKLVEDSGQDYWRDYILGRAEEQPLPRPWTEFSNAEIDRITKMAYVTYHLRPSFMLRHTLACRSFEEFKRKFYAFLEMVFRQEQISTADDDFEAYHDRVVQGKYFRKVSKWSLPF